MTMAKPNPKNEIVCCVQCGRDTSATDAVCWACRGLKRQGGMGKGRGRPGVKRPTLSLEDDYSEDSDAQSGAVGGHE